MNIILFTFVMLWLISAHSWEKLTFTPSRNLWNDESEFKFLLRQKCDTGQNTYCIAVFVLWCMRGLYCEFKHPSTFPLFQLFLLFLFLSLPSIITIHCPPLLSSPSVLIHGCRIPVAPSSPSVLVCLSTPCGPHYRREQKKFFFLGTAAIMCC